MRSSQPATVSSATYGAKILRVAGTFDDCRVLERRLEELFPWGFVEGNLHALALHSFGPTRAVTRPF